MRAILTRRAAALFIYDAAAAYAALCCRCYAIDAATLRQRHLRCCCRLIIEATVRECCRYAMLLAHAYVRALMITSADKMPPPPMITPRSPPERYARMPLRH